MRTERVAKANSGYRRAGKRVRREDSEFQYVLGDGIDLLNPGHWDAVASGQSLFLSRPFCRFMESEGPRLLRTRYAIIYRNETPVAILAARIAPIRDLSTPLNAKIPLRTRASRALPDLETGTGDATASMAGRSLLLCGDFYAGGFHGIAVRDGESLGSLWPAIATALNRVMVQEGLSRAQDYVLIKDIPSATGVDARVLRHYQYRRFETSPNMVLELSSRWLGYDDYLAQLNVRHRLVAHRAARELYKQGYTLQHVSHLEPWSSRVHELYLMAQRRSGALYLPYSRQFLPALTRILDPALVRCSCLFQGAEMLGFVLTLKDRDTAICYTTGWDTAAGQSAPLLHSLLHGVIRDALDLGCQRINFGRTALRIKAQLGAHPDPAELWAMHARAELDLPVATVLETITHAPSGEFATPLPL